MRLKRNYKEDRYTDGTGKVKFSYIKKKGKHKRGKVNSTNK